MERLVVEDQLRKGLSALLALGVGSGVDENVLAQELTIATAYLLHRQVVRQPDLPVAIDAMVAVYGDRLRVAILTILDDDEAGR